MDDPLEFERKVYYAASSAARTGLATIVSVTVANRGYHPPFMPALARFLVVFAAGLAAAATVGKLVPHVAWIVERFGVSLAASGFAVSAVMLPGALLGPLFGMAADRFGARRSALAGLGVQAAASLALPHAASFGALAAVRLAEGVGYSLLAVAATVLVVDVAAARQRALGLAVWSSFAPLGFALGQSLAGAVSPADPLPLVGAVHAVALGAAALALALAVPRDARRAHAAAGSSFLGALAHPPALRTALAFGCATGVLLGAVALAPLALAPASGLSVAATAQLTALAALPGILGRFASGWLLGAAARPIALFLAASIAGSILLAAGLAAPLPFAGALVCFAAFQICIGALPGVMSAMLPLVAPSPRQIGTVSGLVNQTITAGNLLAPPLVLAVYAAAGAGAATALLVAAVAASFWLVSGVAAYRRGLASPPP
jgi:predicted MFS family arabinose efflux permease